VNLSYQDVGRDGSDPAGSGCQLTVVQKGFPGQWIKIKQYQGGAFLFGDDTVEPVDSSNTPWQDSLIVK
jgi:hypothetical protein